MYDSKSGRDFLERNGLVEAYRGPLSSIDTRSLSVHSEPWDGRTAVPGQFYSVLDGAPDNGLTMEWPPRLEG